MAITFRQAREAAAMAEGPTFAEGFEDQEDYNVLLVNPAVDDTVFLVNKESGALRIEAVWDVKDALDAMTPVTDE